MTEELNKGGRKACAYCGKLAPYSANYCSFGCHVEDARKLGGPVITPNKLPICVIRGFDGALMEHEHADHPTYIFPVKAEYAGLLTEADRDDYSSMTGNFDEPVPDDLVRRWKRETHALIYTDGAVAVTLYECCFAMFHVKDKGELAGGSLWKPKEWRLSAEDVTKIEMRQIGIDARAGRRVSA